MGGAGYILTRRRVREIALVSLAYWVAVATLAVTPGYVRGRWPNLLTPTTQPAATQPSTSRPVGPRVASDAAKRLAADLGPRAAPQSAESQPATAAASQPATQPARRRLPPMPPWLMLCGRWAVLFCLGIMAGGVLSWWIGRHARSDSRLSCGLLASAAALAGVLAADSPQAAGLGVLVLGMSAAWLESAVDRMIDRLVSWRFLRAVRRSKRTATVLLFAGTASGTVLAGGIDPARAGGVIAAAASVMALLGLLVTAVRYRRAPVGPARWFIYNTGYFIAHFWHGMRCAGRPRLNARRGAVVAGTHFSAIDPLLLQVCCDKRLMRWMIAREYYEVKAVKWVLRLIGCVPVSRSGHDTGPALAAVRMLREGEVVAIFPHGRIIADPSDPPPIKEGAALLALAAEAPLVPARISGVRHRSVLADWLMPHRNLAVQFGRPIDLSDLAGRHDREAVAEAARRLEAAFALGRRRSRQ